MQFATLVLSTNHGHSKQRPVLPPWAFANQVEPIRPDCLDAMGVGLIWCPDLQRWGVYSLHDPIKVRFFGSQLSSEWSRIIFQGDLGEGTLSDQTLSSISELLASYLKQLWTEKARRMGLLSSQESFRLLHAENDGIPGIVIDAYNDLLVLSCGNAVGDFLLPLVVKALRSAFSPLPLLERSSGQHRVGLGLSERTRWIFAGQENPPLLVRGKINGVSLRFKPLKAQKTGLFLDQRSNLFSFAQLLQHRYSGTPFSVLDVCSYVGAWSATACNVGAETVELIDQDKEALENAVANCVGIPSLGSVRVGPNVQTHHGDLFEVCHKLVGQKKKFDVVVCDPPAFAKSKAHVPQALKAYQKLFKLCAQLLAPGGVLVVCSCSRNVTEEDFLHAVRAGLKGFGEWKLLFRGAQSSDHTTLLHFDAGDYLKCFFLELI